MDQLDNQLMINLDRTINKNNNNLMNNENRDFNWISIIIIFITML